jgi:hypothetical protein
MKKIIVATSVALAGLMLAGCSQSPQEQFIKDAERIAVKHGGERQPGVEDQEILAVGYKMCDLMTTMRVSDVPLFMVMPAVSEEMDMSANGKEAMGEMMKSASVHLCTENKDTATAMASML